MSQSVDVVAAAPRRRCEWCSSDDDYVAYHDQEWGVPHHGDALLFELLTLEGAQAGLSWLTVLRRRAGYRRLFEGFEPDVVARFDDARIATILTDPGVVRHRKKIESVVTNARAIVALSRESGSFDEYVWRNAHVVGDGETIAGAMSKQMSADGFTFVGPTICRSFLSASGVRNEHDATCYRFAEIETLRAG